MEVVAIKKATAVESRQRVYDTYLLLMAGHSRHDILQNFVQLELTDRAIDAYIHKATKMVSEYQKGRGKDAFERHLKLRQSLFLSARAKGNLLLCFWIAQDMGRLEGVYPAEKKGDADSLTAWLQENLMAVPVDHKTNGNGGNGNGNGGHNGNGHNGNGGGKGCIPGQGLD